MQGKLIYEFGPFRLVFGERLLSREGQQVSLSPQLFNLLLLFVARAGRLWFTEELCTAMWGPQTNVNENSAKGVVSYLRKALGDGQNGIRYIETIPGGGYRFVTEIQKVEECSDDPA